MGQGRAKLGLMRALDTNVVVRFLMGDDEQQAAIAADVLATPCLVSNTVLLETGWLLSSRFGIKRIALARLLRELMALPRLSVIDPDNVAWALDRFEAGADLADMLHLVDARHAERFATFDRALAPAAGPNTPVPIDTLA